MTTARLAALAAYVTDPAVEANLYRGLGMNVVAPDSDTTEVRFDDGFVLRVLRGEILSRTHLGFRVRDAADAAKGLNKLSLPWKVDGPNHISVEGADSTVYVLQCEPGESPGLIASTHFAADVASSARWYRALGLAVGEADTAVATATHPDDPPDLSADVYFDNAVLQLWPAGLRPVTAVHTVIRIDDVQAVALGLDELGWGFGMDGDALVTRDPDGCRVRVTGRRR